MIRQWDAFLFNKTGGLSTGTCVYLIRYFAAGDSLRVRRVAIDCIPGATRKHSEGGTWITQLTWSRKAKGTIACCGKQRSVEDMYADVLQDPRTMARARLPEAQFSGEYLSSHRHHI